MLTICNTIGLVMLFSWLIYERLKFKGDSCKGDSRIAPTARALVQVRSGQIADSAITLDHLDTEVLDLLTPSPSAATAVVAGTAISITKPVMRIYGSPGDVVMTATPNIAAGDYDGQTRQLQGTDDSATVTVRDASNLASSGLHLQHGRDFTMGKNDMLELMWDDSQSLWIELRRIDNY